MSHRTICDECGGSVHKNVPPEYGSTTRTAELIFSCHHDDGTIGNKYSDDFCSLKCLKAYVAKLELK